MKRILVPCALLLSFVVAAAPASAAVIELVPAVQSGPLGTSFDVDVVVSGLGASVAPSLGSFDFDVTYDDTVLAPTGVVFGSLLGDSGLFEAFAGSSFGSGIVDLFEVSLLDPATLDALQPASFVLATLGFEAVGEGTSPLAFTQTILGDAFGEPLAVTAAGGRIRVGDAQVPEPASALLLAIGLAVWLTPLRRRRAGGSARRATR